MLDPVLVDDASMLPGCCALCKSITGPFIYTKVVLSVLGQVYICAHTCGSQIADLCSSQKVDAVQEQLDEAIAEVAILQAELAHAEASRVVPLADVRDFLLNVGQTVSNGTPRCAAVRKDGSPCTAFALAGRETCVAHSKVAA